MSVSRLMRTPCRSRSDWTLESELEVDDVVLPHPGSPELLGDGLHEARPAAPADPGEDLNHAVVVVEPADLLEVALAREQTHAGPNLSTGAGIANNAFIGVSMSESTIYTPITAEFPTPTQ